MERSEVKTEWEKPPESPLANMSNEQIHELLEYRSKLMQGAAEHYKSLVEAIFKLPIHVIYRQNAFMNIDQGWHWVQKAIDNIWELPKEEEPAKESE